jgi:polysaccharide deacetylase 2 family uncharacterized protein YibQ
MAGGLVAAGVAALVLVPGDPRDGQPGAIARIEPLRAPEPRPAPPATPSAPEAETGAVAGAAPDSEAVAGVKVTRRGESGSSARIIHIDPPSAVRLAPAPDARVTERSRYGLLPRVGAAGERPMDVYARPFAAPAARAGAPRLALVVGGVGLDPQTTNDAIERLPEATTLAFAPYGKDVARLAAQARARGHETLLQTPMEPFDYPANNPGPHTLLTGAADGGVDDLHWLMSRFTGYAGVMNHLGGRFTADAAAMRGALSEIAGRGLFYLEDGLSPQSRADGAAKTVSAPFAKVDVAIGQPGAAETMEAALSRLEALARDKGVAIGFANATPDTIARLARFARDLERRGVVLAPVSATLAAQGAPTVVRPGP